MRMIFLGTCSGTEPFPGRKHTSVVFDIGGRLYFFDAGEGCSYTAHTMGLDLSKVQKILLSHPHMDHVGGLGNLLWVIRKLRYTYDMKIDHDIEVFTPSMDTYRGTMMTLNETEGNFATDYLIKAKQVTDGVLFDEDGVKVTAMHNLHLKHRDDAGFLSYSYLIEAEGKRVVYSGDVKSIAELDCWLSCDALLMETGHHVPAEVAAYAAGKDIGKLIFMHHGRTILSDPDGQRALVAQVFGEDAVITDDGMIIEL